MIIGLHGKIKSGKTFLSQRSMENGFIPLSFAHKVKEMLNVLSNVDLTNFEKQEFKSQSCPAFCNKTPREALIALGTAWGREMIGEDIWVKAVERQVIDIINRNKLANIIITDVRYENEAIFIKSNGGVIVEVTSIFPDKDEDKNNIIDKNLIDKIFVNDFNGYETQLRFWRLIQEIKKGETHEQN